MESIVDVDIQRISKDSNVHQTDCVALESPLAINIIHNGQKHSLGILMRTPGNDTELVYGFLYCEGVIESIDDILNIQFDDGNCLAELSEKSKFDPEEHIRKTSVSSACGVCGRDSISNMIHVHGPEIMSGQNISLDIISNSIDVLRSSQSLFSATGGTHAAALINFSGDLCNIAEDVGRHNALDKLIGSSMISRIMPLSNYLLVVSGRASFELTYKAIKCGLPMMIAVGAPSSMAVEMSREHGMTLVGFAKAEKISVYSCPSRVSND